MGLHLDEVYLSTLGVDLASYQHTDEDMDINFQIWDLGGQPEFKEIRTQQYIGSEGGLLVFDKDRSETFEHLVDWLEELHSSINKEIPLFVIGNKSDLLTEEENKVFDEKAKNFIVEYEYKYSKIKLCDYLPTCALTGENVKKAFLGLGREIIKRKSDELII